MDKRKNHQGEIGGRGAIINPDQRRGKERDVLNPWEPADTPLPNYEQSYVSILRGI